MSDSELPLTRRTVLKGLTIGTVAIMSSSQLQTEAAPIRAASPESLGISPDAILAFVESADQQLGGLHSFVLLRHGKEAARGGWSPYTPQTPHMLFSLSKSFTSTAVGMAVAEGRLSVDDKVLSFFPDDAPEKPDANLSKMKVRHLLTMSTGHEKETTGAMRSREDGNWVKGFLSLPVEHAPGAPFVYNSGASHMLSAIVQKVTGQTLLDYLTPRLFKPLGFKDPKWDSDPKGINTGGWGLNINTEEIARFGQLYLRKGVWNGKRLLSEEWVGAATSKQVSNGDGGESDWAQGYGYQFWRCRHNIYRGDGAFGQYCVVMPEQDAVLAITSGVGNMQAVLNLAWEHLLPGMKDGAVEGDMTIAGRQRLEKLTLKPQEGSRTSPRANEVSEKTYHFEPNDEKIESVSLKFDGDRCRLSLRNEAGTERLESGYGEWVKGKLTTGGSTPQKVAASGAWTDDDTYVVQLCHYETPFIRTMTFRFEGDTLTLNSKANVGFGPTERPALIGRAK